MEISKQIQNIIDKDKNLYNNRYLFGYFIFVLVFLIFGFFWPIKKLETEQIHYIYSAIPQILGALVGLLLAGYCFSSGLSAAKVRVHFQEDAKQIDKIISSIQKSNLGRFSLLSYFSFSCIVISLACVALSEFHDASAEIGIESYLYPLCNIATALFLISLFLCYRVTEIFLSGKTLDNALNKVAVNIDKSPTSAPPPSSHNDELSNTPIEEEDDLEDLTPLISGKLDEISLENLPKEISTNSSQENIETIEKLSFNIKKLAEFIKSKKNEKISDKDLFQKLFLDGKLSQNNVDSLNNFFEYTNILEIQASHTTKIPKTLINMTLRAYRKLKKAAVQPDQ